MSLFEKLCNDFARRRPQGQPTGRVYWFTTYFTSGFQSLNDLLRRYLKDHDISYLNTVNGDVWFLFKGEWTMCEFVADGDKVDVYLREYAR